MSIWGKRIDERVARLTGSTSRSDYDRAGLSLLWQGALVLVVAVLAWLIAR